MKYARLFSIFVFAVIALYGAIGFYCLPQANFAQNLTRMGMIPESLFTLTKEQPAVDTALLQQASWQEADVLAIGDSFTMPLLWQTALTKRGLRVRTETWESVRDICEDFSSWLRGKGFRGRYVVMEIIELHVESQLARSVRCQHMSYHEVPEIRAPRPIATPTPPSRATPMSQLSGRLSVGIQTQFNAWKYGQLSSEPGFTGLKLPNGVRIERLADGCSLFSHPACNDVLFYSEDHVPDFDQNTVSQMEELTSRLHGVTPIWAIIPDKSTAYLYSDKKFWNEVEHRFHSPNLLKIYRNAIQNKTVDLYLAGDSHFSTVGYLLLGEAIYQSMRP